MKNNICFKLFTLLSALILFVFPAFSQEENSNNVLSKIEVEHSIDNTYKLNLFFYEKYTGNAIIQKNKKGSYHVFIPNTAINGKSLKVVYQNKNDESDIKISPEEGAFLKNGSEIKYIKLHVNAEDNYPIKLYSKVLEDDESYFTGKSLNIVSFIIIIALAVLCILLFKIFNSAKKFHNYNSYTYSPSSKKPHFDNFNKDNELKSKCAQSSIRPDSEYSITKPDDDNKILLNKTENNAEKEIIQKKSNPVPQSDADSLTKPKYSPLKNKTNSNVTLNSKTNESFTCFDIPVEESISNPVPHSAAGSSVQSKRPPFQDAAQKKSHLYKSPLKETSAIYKKKMLKSKQTNPYNILNSDESATLKLPAAEDVLKIDEKNEKNVKTAQDSKKNSVNEPCLLSKLEITPTKGFYLASTDNDNIFGLFGYAGKNIHLLKTFTDLSQINLQARFYDRQNNCDLYIVRLDTYKAMIEISDSGVRELAAL